MFLYLYLYCCLLTLQQFDMLELYTVEFTSVNITKSVVEWKLTYFVFILSKPFLEGEREIRCNLGYGLLNHIFLWTTYA